MGPGTGYASKEIIEASKNYLAIEYSRENVKEFKLNYPKTKVLNIDFIHNEIEKNYHDQKFDTIISLANIYYFDFTKISYKERRSFNCKRKVILFVLLILCTLILMRHHSQ